MLFKAEIYKCPIKQIGKFENVFIKDSSIHHEPDELRLTIGFKMYYVDEDGVKQRIQGGEASLTFKGDDTMNNTPMSTNRTAYVEVPNPGYDSSIPKEISAPNPMWYEGSDLTETIMIANPDYTPEFIKKPTLQVLEENNFELPEGTVIVDYGFPNYTDALKYFTGGDMLSPEIHLTNPIAIEFLRNELRFNGKPLGSEFQLVTQ